MYNMMTTDSAGNPTKLAQAGQYFEYLSRAKSRWSIFTREAKGSWPGEEIDVIGDANNPKPSGAIIETWEDVTKEQGGDHVRMPILGRMTKPPLGDAEAEGQGEEIPMTYRDLYLAMYRKPIRKMTGMQAQRTPTAVLNAVNDSNSWLYRYYDEWFDGAVQHTLLTGFDPLLTDYRDFDGATLNSDVKAYSHPNLTVAGVGRVSQSAGLPGTAAYEAECVTSLNSLIGNTGRGLTVQRVLTYQALAERMGLPKMRVGGKDYTVWMLDRAQHLQLTQDPEWKDAFLYAGTRDKTNPLFTGAESYYNGNLFFVDPASFGVQHTGQSVATVTGTYVIGSMPAYGPSGFWIGDTGLPTARDNNSIKIAWILAPAALHRLYGRIRHEFAEQKGDFGKRVEIVHNSYQSLCRGDIKDTNNEYGGGAGSVFANRTSMPIATWSPFTDSI